MFFVTTCSGVYLHIHGEENWDGLYMVYENICHTLSKFTTIYMCLNLENIRILKLCV